jgi:hypothetical protein
MMICNCFANAGNYNFYDQYLIKGEANEKSHTCTNRFFKP